MVLALTSPGKQQNHQSLEKQQKRGTDVLWLPGPCKRNVVGTSSAARAGHRADAVLGAPSMCRAPCAAAVLETSPSGAVPVL